MKKIDRYVLMNFAGLMLVTFFLCVFVLLMQFVWMHVQDLVGKGVPLKVLAEFFVYAVVTVVPLALPLSILLASLMTFGNLGEKVELTAMKAAGVSIFRIMQPLIITVAFICVGAVWFSNKIMPASQVKLWTLIFSLRQKSPELDIPTGEFYEGIQGYNFYVEEKGRNGCLKGLMVYDFSKGFQDATVIVADSAHLYVSQDKKYLVLSLYDGESFENLEQRQQNATKTRDRIPYRRETFQHKRLLIDFDSDFSRYDESILRDQHVAKDINELLHSIDSVKAIANEKIDEQTKGMTECNYFGRDVVSGRALPKVSKNAQRLDYDSLFTTMSNADKEPAISRAIMKAQELRDKVDYNGVVLEENLRYLRKHEMELHRKFTLAFACLIFFFIGAPLGAIVRKGGFGMPVVLSVVLFVIYYIIDNAGYKMAREDVWPVWAGIWLSSAILLPIGIFLTWKAATDSALLNPEAWIRGWEKFVKGLKNCKLLLNRGWMYLKKIR